MQRSTANRGRRISLAMAPEYTSPLGKTRSRSFGETSNTKFAMSSSNLVKMRRSAIRRLSEAERECAYVAYTLSGHFDVDFRFLCNMLGIDVCVTYIVEQEGTDTVEVRTSADDLDTKRTFQRNCSKGVKNINLNIFKYCGQNENIEDGMYLVVHSLYNCVGL